MMKENLMEKKTFSLFPFSSHVFYDIPLHNEGQQGLHHGTEGSQEDGSQHDQHVKIEDRRKLHQSVPLQVNIATHFSVMQNGKRDACIHFSVCFNVYDKEIISIFFFDVTVCSTCSMNNTSPLWKIL